MQFVKKLIPDKILQAIRPIYHGGLAILASFYFGRPSEKMVVVGVTGTAGKSTTVAMLAHILNTSGKKCGFMTTVSFSDGSNQYLNKHGLSMAGGWLLQKQLAIMVEHGCEYAIIECTSEGLAQNRHLGINFDVVLFTNLSRAHIEAHGSFGNYQIAKGKLFRELAKHPRKQIFPQKMIGANLDDPMAGYFFSFAADVKFGYSLHNLKVADAKRIFQVDSVTAGVPASFTVDGHKFILSLLGPFNVNNAALAAAAADLLGVDLPICAESLKNFYGVRGRMETIPNAKGLHIIIDYGCEPASFRAAVEAAAQLPHNRLIHVFGSTGGHRDKDKRFAFGKTSAQFADFILVTNDDIYDSDPQEIANNIEEGINSFKLRKPVSKIILDRRLAIAAALVEAKKDDIVLITGKGSEQFLVLPGNKRIFWDERDVVAEELKKIQANV